MQTQFAVKVAVPGVSFPLSYALSAADSEVSVGAEVVIELGKRKAKGWVIEKGSFEEIVKEVANEIAKQTEKADQVQLSFLVDDRLNKLKTVLSASRAFLPDQLQLFRWMVDYYGSTWSEVIGNALPAKAYARVIPCIKPTEKLTAQLIADAEFLETLKKKAPLQAHILLAVKDCVQPYPLSELRQHGSSLSSAVSALIKKGFLQSVELSPFDLTVIPHLLFSSEKPEQLTAPQQQAISVINEAITAATFSPFLLYGITGSGKTEVYLNAIQEVLRHGGSALVIVPEIALTPQLLDRFYFRLGIPIAVLHSQVGDAARWNAWESLLHGNYRVVLGARSAVFAPVHNLRLIVVDEEHESSYKQSDGLRYHGRDVAVMRAKFASCPVILGSATPSFESLLNTQKGSYRLLELPERATVRSLPALEVVDLGAIKRREMPSENISPQLHQAMKETLEKKGQVIILYNRRGFSSYFQCESCSEVVSCPNCSVTLTYHRRLHRLLCHYCDLSIPPPEFCKFCRDPRTTSVEIDESNGKPTKHGILVHRGGGTERVVDELVALFPQATIARMDRDAVANKGDYRRILGDVRHGRTDILVGTQMVAKGHDLPGVTVVGIIDADVGLHLPDFRSSERAFQLITQAAGRAGRGEEAGRVIVQTREPKHPTIVATVTNRFKAFARFELEHRKALSYPPYGRLLRLIISSPDKDLAKRSASLLRKEFENFIKQFPPDSFTPLGPAPAPHEKLRNRYRFHLLIKSPSAKFISQLARHLSTWKSATLSRLRGDVRLAIDVDPVEML